MINTKRLRVGVCGRAKRRSVGGPQSSAAHTMTRYHSPSWHRRMERTGPVDPAFKAISKTSTAFLIWRVENLQLVPVPKDQYGTFYDGDSYIVYVASEYGRIVCPGEKVREVRGRLEMHIHFWLGQETSQDESAIAAFKSVELDDYLGGSPVQHRELMAHESLRFKAYFPNGIRLMKGGVGSGLNSVNNNLDPRLFRVKGRRCPVLTQMPAISWQYFNSGDVFIIDTEDVVFIWIGKSANGMEKLQAVKVAMQLKDEHNAISIVFVDEGRENELLEAEKLLLGVYLDLSPLAKRGMGESTNDDVKAELEARNALKLYKCSDADGTYKVIEMKTGRLKQSDLDRNDSFIIDNGPAEVWVWVGKNASRKERVEAMRNAHGFLKKKNYPASTRVTRVVDGGEPVEFKALFPSWRAASPSPTASQENGLNKKRVATKLDVGGLAEAPETAAREQLIDDGSGRREVWRVVEASRLEPVPLQMHSLLYSAECYIIKYTYTPPNSGKPRHILYYWLGEDSGVTDQTATALLTVAQDDELSGAGVQVRVVQGREPPHLLAVLRGRLVTMRGHQMHSLPNSVMLQVRGNANHNTSATQVEMKAGSLNSNDVFILSTVSGTYIWCGKGSTGDEREMAKQLTESIFTPEYTVLYEGQEKDDFWEALGGKGSYHSEKRLQEEKSDKFIRLFHCSNASGSFKVEEVVGFSQRDLLSEDVMLLDAIDTIFVWIGSQANREEKTKSLHFAFDYLQADPAGRDSKTPVMQISEGFEPPNFTGFFGAWDPSYWKKNKSFEEIRKELDCEKPALQVELKVGNGIVDFSQCEKFPVEVLREKDPDKLPLSVDVIHKETHLSGDDFQSIFGMDYPAFTSLPKWKQENLKKAAGLF